MKAFRITEIESVIKEAIEINSKQNKKHRFMCVLDDPKDGYTSYMIDYFDAIKIYENKDNVDPINDIIFWCDLYTGDILSLQSVVEIAKRVTENKKVIDSIQNKSNDEGEKDGI